MSAGTEKSRVLLVDDDRTMLDSLAQMVESCGYEALPARSWAEALMLFRKQIPDIVLLDVMMPTIDGFKLARMIKAESGHFVPIILITGLGDADSKRRGMAAGADDFLSKPVAPLELEVRLNAMLRIKELTDQIAAANAKLAELATTDALTSLCNRRAIYEHLDREFHRSQRYGNPFAVFLLDIDHFKLVNDTWGHAMGDRIIVRVARILTETVRQTDFTGRYGGEEFLVLAPETPHVNARVLAERIRARVEHVSRSDDELPEVTVSIGIASSDNVAAEHYEELVQAADVALYEAKNAGRNRCVAAIATTPPPDEKRPPSPGE
ncbi:MAG TPA: diguanylate cyclase [Kofleriaceae bacterium]|nr:diguanylate cyclase [Kofleriaceae bacterium]